MLTDSQFAFLVNIYNIHVFTIYKVYSCLIWEMKNGKPYDIV